MAGTETVEVALTDGILEDVAERLELGTTRYRNQISGLAERFDDRRPPAQESTPEQPAEAAGAFAAIPYSFFQLITIGPFQPIGSGPLRPSRIIRSSEPAFLLAAVWRNPLPLGFMAGNPSAADILAGQAYTIRGYTVSLNEMTHGPSIGSKMGTFGSGFLDFAVFRIPPIAPRGDGLPGLFEIIMIMEAGRGETGLPPFAGFASTWDRLDMDPPFVLPHIPSSDGDLIVMSGQIPQSAGDVPLRFMVHSTSAHVLTTPVQGSFIDDLGLSSVQRAKLYGLSRRYGEVEVLRALQEVFGAIGVVTAVAAAAEEES